MLLQDETLVAVTELGDTLVLDLSMFYMDYCDLMRSVWEAGPVLWEVDDRANIEAPAENEFVRLAHHTDNFLPRQLRLGLDPVSAGPARDVNRLGEVPSSSWYRAGAMPTPVSWTSKRSRR